MQQAQTALRLVIVALCVGLLGCVDGAGDSGVTSDECTLSGVSSNSIDGDITRDADGRIVKIGAWSLDFSGDQLSKLTGPNGSFAIEHKADGSIMRSAALERFIYTFDGDKQLKEVVTEIRMKETDSFGKFQADKLTWTDGDVTQRQLLTKSGAVQTTTTYTYSKWDNPLRELGPVALHAMSKSHFLGLTRFVAKESSGSKTSTYTATVQRDKFVTGVEVKFEGLSWSPLASASFRYTCK